MTSQSISISSLAIRVAVSIVAAATKLPSEPGVGSWCKPVQLMVKLAVAVHVALAQYAVEFTADTVSAVFLASPPVVISLGSLVHDVCGDGSALMEMSSVAFVAPVVPD